MAEDFELYHIPQQSRRDKLRVLIQNHHHSATGDLLGCAGLALYDPSSLLSPSPTLLSCANATLNQQPTTTTAADSGTNSATNASDYGIAGAIMDLQSVRDSDSDTHHRNLPYSDHDIRLIHHHDPPFHGGDMVVYKPAPLALSLFSHNTNNNSTQESNRYYVGGDSGRRTTVALAPYTGYASILKGSKFLKPAQELLDETCDVGLGIYAEKFGVDCGLMADPPPLESLRICVDDPNYGGGEKSKKSRLISLLDEVYKRYKQYYQQIQAIIASFEAVAGLSTAAPFANLDLKMMSKHFRCLNDAITDQLQFSTKPHEHHISYGKEELPWSGNSDKGFYGQNAGYVDHQPMWRPQRGLPKRAVTVLRAWLFDHFLHPYPTDTDKQMLAKQTGLSRNQVSNWFINARVRLWKPMVEEVHSLEIQQIHKPSSHISEHETPSIGNSILSHQTNQNPPSKRPRNDFPSSNNLVERNKEPTNFYENFSSESRGVSLTLGLHQNAFGGVGLDGGVMGGFLHDFGG